MADNSYFRDEVARLQAQNGLLKAELDLQQNIASPNSETACVLREIVKWFDNMAPATEHIRRGGIANEEKTNTGRSNGESTKLNIERSTTETTNSEKSNKEYTNVERTNEESTNTESSRNEGNTVGFQYKSRLAEQMQRELPSFLSLLATTREKESETETSMIPPKASQKTSIHDLSGTVEQPLLRSEEGILPRCEPRCQLRSEADLLPRSEARSPLRSEAFLPTRFEAKSPLRSEARSPMKSEACLPPISISPAKAHRTPAMSSTKLPAQSNTDMPSLRLSDLTNSENPSLQPSSTNSQKVSRNTVTTDNLNATKAIGPDVYLLPDRVLGEVAFQLDRRILSYVYNGQSSPNQSVPKTWRQRFYGFTIMNIADMIEFESRGRDNTNNPQKKFDTNNAQERLDMTYRHRRILKFLSQFGYELSRHPIACINLVNTYGLLLCEDKALESRGLQDPYVVRHTAQQILKQGVDDGLEDFFVLFNCLVALSSEEGNQLFIF